MAKVEHGQLIGWKQRAVCGIQKWYVSVIGSSKRVREMKNVRNISRENRKKKTGQGHVVRRGSGEESSRRSNNSIEKIRGV